jgi:hypothetical protein
MIMTGKIRLDLQQIPTLDVVQTAIDSAMPAAEAKHIRLRALLDLSTPPATPIMAAPRWRPH